MDSVVGFSRETDDIKHVYDYTRHLLERLTGPEVEESQ